MAIEGPLRELGIHDVFQLLDLSRKTGLLRVWSELRDDEGTVAFDGGRVVLAHIRSMPTRLETSLLVSGRVSEADLDRAKARCSDEPSEAEIAEVLLEIGALTTRELDRHVRQQIENVVFELMSWQEGHFSFEERSRQEMPRGVHVAVSIESLLMEGARRIDEWSRIVETVASIEVVPELAPVADDRAGSLLDLLPHEWHMLTMIDGARDLRTIAATLAREEFEIAKIAYGLASTGVIILQPPRRASITTPSSASVDTVARLTSAREHGVAGRVDAALEELRRAVRADPLAVAVHRALGFAAARAGDLELARSSWEQYLRLVDGSPDARPIESALDALERFIAILDAHVAD
jgi:hypothetical protein